MRKIVTILFACILLMSCVGCASRTPVYGEIDLSAEEELRIQDTINGVWLSKDQTTQIEFRVLKSTDTEFGGLCDYVVHKKNELVSSHSYDFKLNKNILTLVSIDDGTDTTAKNYSVSLNKSGNELTLTDTNNETIIFDLIVNIPIENVTLD